MGKDAEAALPKMIRALNDPTRIVRSCAVGPVAAFGEKAKSAVPILEQWLTSDDAVFRVIAAGHIPTIDPSKADGLLPVLIDALESETTFAAFMSASMLEQLGELAGGAVAHLRHMLQHPDSSMRVAASEAIYAITGDAREAIQVGLDLLDAGDWLQRYVGAELLGSPVPPKSGTCGPRGPLSHREPSFRRAAGPGSTTLKANWRSRAVSSRFPRGLPCGPRPELHSLIDRVDWRNLGIDCVESGSIEGMSV
jgi:hypothetical protein